MDIGQRVAQPRSPGLFRPTEFRLRGAWQNLQERAVQAKRICRRWLFLACEMLLHTLPYQGQQIAVSKVAVGEISDEGVVEPPQRLTRRVIRQQVGVAAAKLEPIKQDNETGEGRERAVSGFVGKDAQTLRQAGVGLVIVDEAMRFDHA